MNFAFLGWEEVKGEDESDEDTLFRAADTDAAEEQAQIGNAGVIGYDHFLFAKEGQGCSGIQTLLFRFQETGEFLGLAALRSARMAA